ncbi:ParB-like protein [Streptomyces chiangmaiensis]
MARHGAGLGLANFTNDKYRSVLYFGRDIGYAQNGLPFQEFYWGSWVRDAKPIDLAGWDQNDLGSYLATVKGLTQVMTALPKDAAVDSGFSPPTTAGRRRPCPHRPDQRPAPKASRAGAPRACPQSGRQFADDRPVGELHRSLGDRVRFPALGHVPPQSGDQPDPRGFLGSSGNLVVVGAVGHRGYVRGELEALAEVGPGWRDTGCGDP